MKWKIYHPTFQKLYEELKVHLAQTFRALPLRQVWFSFQSRRSRFLLLNIEENKRWAEQVDERHHGTYPTQSHNIVQGDSLSVTLISRFLVACIKCWINRCYTAFLNPVIDTHFLDVGYDLAPSSPTISRNFTNITFSWEVKFYYVSDTSLYSAS